MTERRAVGVVKRGGPLDGALDVTWITDSGHLPGLPCHKLDEPTVAGIYWPTFASDNDDFAAIDEDGRYIYVWQDGKELSPPWKARVPRVRD